LTIVGSPRLWVPGCCDRLPVKCNWPGTGRRCQNSQRSVTCRNFDYNRVY